MPPSSSEKEDGDFSRPTPRRYSVNIKGGSDSKAGYDDERDGVGSHNGGEIGVRADDVLATSSGESDVEDRYGIVQAETEVTEAIEEAAAMTAARGSNNSASSRNRRSGRGGADEKRPGDRRTQYSRRSMRQERGRGRDRGSHRRDFGYADHDEDTETSDSERSYDEYASHNVDNSSGGGEFMYYKKGSVYSGVGNNRRTNEAVSRRQPSYRSETDDDNNSEERRNRLRRPRKNRARSDQARMGYSKRAGGYLSSDRSDEEEDVLSDNTRSAAAGVSVNLSFDSEFISHDRHRGRVVRRVHSLEGTSTEDDDDFDTGILAARDTDDEEEEESTAVFSEDQEDEHRRRSSGRTRQRKWNEGDAMSVQTKEYEHSRTVAVLAKNKTKSMRLGKLLRRSRGKKNARDTVEHAPSSHHSYQDIDADEESSYDSEYSSTDDDGVETVWIPPTEEGISPSGLGGCVTLPFLSSKECDAPSKERPEEGMDLVGITGTISPLGGCAAAIPNANVTATSPAAAAADSTANVFDALYFSRAMTLATDVGELGVFPVYEVEEEEEGAYYPPPQMPQGNVHYPHTAGRQFYGSLSPMVNAGAFGNYPGMPISGGYHEPAIGGGSPYSTPYQIGGNIPSHSQRGTNGHSPCYAADHAVHGYDNNSSLKVRGLVPMSKRIEEEREAREDDRRCDNRDGLRREEAEDQDRVPGSTDAGAKSSEGTEVRFEDAALYRNVLRSRAAARELHEQRHMIQNVELTAAKKNGSFRFFSKRGGHKKQFRVSRINGLKRDKDAGFPSPPTPPRAVEVAAEPKGHTKSAVTSSPEQEASASRVGDTTVGSTVAGTGIKSKGNIRKLVGASGGGGVAKKVGLRAAMANARQKKKQKKRDKPRFGDELAWNRLDARTRFEDPVFIEVGPPEDTGTYGDYSFDQESFVPQM